MAIISPIIIFYSTFSKYNRNCQYSPHGPSGKEGRRGRGYSWSACAGDDGNTNLLFPPNNILQQKFNMATPNNFLNRYSSFSYGLPLAPWTVTAQPLFAFPHHSHLPQLQHHLAFNYIPQHPYFALPSQPPHALLPNVNTPPALARPASLLPPGFRPSFENKI